MKFINGLMDMGKKDYGGKKKTHNEYSVLGGKQTAIVNRKKQITTYEKVIDFLLKHEGAFFSLQEILEMSGVPLMKEYLRIILGHSKHKHLWKHIPEGYVLHKEWRNVMVMSNKGCYKMGSPQHYYCLRPITSYDEELLTNPPIEEEEE